MTSRELEVVPGRSLGRFEIGMSQESLPAEFEYVRRPGASGLPDWLLVRGLPVKLYLDTSPMPGVDEIEVAAGLGAVARLGAVDLLGRPVADVLADLAREGVELPHEDPDDPGSHHARGWSFWAPEATIEGVLVERFEFLDDPPDLRSRMEV